MVKFKMEIVLYILCGIGTTVVNYGSDICFTRWCGILPSVANILSWILSTVFAYLTNKKYVFEKTNWALRTMVSEFSKFLATRLFSGCLEIGIFIVLVEWCRLDDILVNIGASIIAVLMNYVASKLYIFKK